jgi:hypothetical protein
MAGWPEGGGGGVRRAVWEEGREGCIYLMILLSRYSTSGQAGDAWFCDFVISMISWCLLATKIDKHTDWKSLDGARKIWTAKWGFKHLNLCSYEISNVTRYISSLMELQSIFFGSLNNTILLYIDQHACILPSVLPRYLVVAMNYNNPIFCRLVYHILLSALNSFAATLNDWARLSIFWAAYSALLCSVLCFNKASWGSLVFASPRGKL